MEDTDDEVQALVIQMNQVYGITEPSAIAIEAGDEPPTLARLNPLKQVKLSTYPGYHLPHAWLAKDWQSPRIS